VECCRVRPPSERRQLLIPPAKALERPVRIVGNDETIPSEPSRPRIALGTPRPGADRDAEKGFQLTRRELHPPPGEQGLDDDPSVVVLGHTQREMTGATHP